MKLASPGLYSVKLETPLENLDAEGLTNLLGQVEAFKHRILRRLDPSPAPPPAPAEPATGIWNLTAAQVRGRTGMSRSWLYRHAPTLPFAGRVGTRWRFSAKKLENYLRDGKQGD
jgi:hypothetical protein